MVAQTVQVVACVASTTGVADDFCGVINGTPHVRALVEMPLLDAATIAAIQAAAEPFNYALAGQFFAASLGLVLVAWATAFGVGVVIRTLELV
jgi:hypothetical protein